MNRKSIDLLAYAEDISQALKNGVFLTTKSGEKVNSMVIAVADASKASISPISTD